MKYIDLAKLRSLLLAVTALAAMWGLVSNITHAQDDLESSISEGGVEFVSLKSMRAMNPRLGDVVIVDSVSNKEPVAATFSWTDASGRFRFAGSILPAQKKRMQIIPKTLTQSLSKM